MPVKYNKIILTGNADDYNNQQIVHNRLLFLSAEDFWHYQGFVPDSTIEIIIGPLISDQYYGMYFKLEQRSISADAYLFWNGVQKQLEANGKFFDPVASQIEGNIKCTNDPNSKALGVFYAYDQSEKCIFLYMDSTKNMSSQPVDDFIQVKSDSLYWHKPDGWIIPPYIIFPSSLM
jgi:hypothetical protein